MDVQTWQNIAPATRAAATTVFLGFRCDWGRIECLMLLVVLSSRPPPPDSHHSLILQERSKRKTLLVVPLHLTSHQLRIFRKMLINCCRMTPCRHHKGCISIMQDLGSVCNAHKIFRYEFVTL